MKLPIILTYIASWLSISAGVYGLFNIAGQNVKPETKKAVSIWLKSVDLTNQTPNWPATFISLFDRVFSERHFSFKCFLRSSIASVSAVLTSVLILSLVGVDFVELGSAEFMGMTSANPYGWLVWIMVFCTVTLNIIPDYLSLLETRYLLKIMRNRQSFLLTIALLLIDVFATMFIFVFVGILPILLLFFGFFGESGVIPSPELFLKSLTPGGSLFDDLVLGTPFSTFFYSTFFTSFWIWLYVSSGLILKIVTIPAKGLAFLQRHLNIDEMPIRAMGFTLLLLITLGYAVIGVGLLIRSIVS